MQDVDVEKITSLADLVNKYGFLIVVGVIILILGTIFMIKFIKHYDEEHAAKLERERIEHELTTQERKDNMKNNKEMMHLVSEVQGAQVNEMKQISETMTGVSKMLVQQQRHNDKIDMNVDTLKMGVSGITDDVKTLLYKISVIDDKMSTLITEQDRNKEEIIREISHIHNEIENFMIKHEQELVTSNKEK